MTAPIIGIIIASIGVCITLVAFVLAIANRHRERYPRLSDAKVQAIAARFDAKSWDETADADKQVPPSLAKLKEQLEKGKVESLAKAEKNAKAMFGRTQL